MAFKDKETARKYGKEWYYKNYEKRRKAISDNTRKRRELNRQLSDAYLSEHPCVDCGEDDIIVLQYDHVRGVKINEVSILKLRNTWDKVKQEIDKCEVRCANCHIRRHAKERA